jgi:hypothetical protein
MKPGESCLRPLAERIPSGGKVLGRLEGAVGSMVVENLGEKGPSRDRNLFSMWRENILKGEGQ